MEVSVICHLIVEVTSHHLSSSTERSKSLGPVQTHWQQIIHRREYQEGGVILGAYSPHRFSSVQFSSAAQSCLTLCDPWIAARQASLSITNSRSLPKLMSIESVMPSSHLILCRPLLFLPPIPPSISVFFQWVNPLREVAKVLEFHLQHQSFHTDYMLIKDLWEILYHNVLTHSSADGHLGCMAQKRVLWDNPEGLGVEGGGRGSGWRGHTYLGLIHADVWWKPLTILLSNYLPIKINH